MIRTQASMDIAGKASAEDRELSVIYNHLIWCDRIDNCINEPRPSLLPIRDDISAREARLSTVHSDRDWDFLYRSLSGPSANVTQLLKNSLNVSAKPAVKSDIRTLKRAPLSERIRQSQQGLRRQRMVNAIFDTGAQVTTMPESAVNRMPSAHNHRDAPPGTAVKYGNGEIEHIETLVDIGHFEVQVTPDNCAATLISVDQIVQDGHTVTFSATETIITDDCNRYQLAYPRVQDSREWSSQKRTRAQPPRVLLTHIRSGRLHELARTKRRRVLRLHKRMIHAPEDIMCYAVQGERPLWKNTNVTPKDIRQVFRLSPCLTCVLAKKRKKGMAQWKPRKKFKRLRKGKQESDSPDRPVNPTSFEGYSQAFIWRDTCTKRMFSHSDSEASEDVYLEGLEEIRQYYKKHGIKIKIIRTDDFTTFKSKKVRAYYAKHGIERQSSTPYQHRQNSVERDIQTMIHNISAVIHGSLLMRADLWHRALKHWIKVHNDLPRSAHRYSPNAMMDNQHQVDARYQYRFGYGDIVCYPLSEKERRWKFDTKNELGFYLGDKKGMKGGCHVYQPYWHKILTRGDVHRTQLSEFELMEWYGKRAHVRQSGLSWSTVEEAMIDLLQHKPYMHARAPRPAVEEQSEDDSDDDGDAADQGQPPDEAYDDHPMAEDAHPNTIILPVETRPIEELRAGARRRSNSERKRTASFIEESYQEGETVWEEDGELVRGINVLQQLNAHMETDDNDNEARIASIYRILTMHDPETLSVPDADDENISTRDALKAPDAGQFKVAIIKEVTDLIETTKTLTPLSTNQVKARSTLYWLIGTTLKCKRKKKGNGQPDKHKARGAARGDQLTAKILKAGMPLPPTFSPTVKPLTFAFMIQIAIALGLIWCTADIKAA
eukprot:gene35124-biopygen27765